MPLLLSCQALTASFGANRLFEDLSLSISDGDRLGLIGPNGSGKSTLLDVLAGVRPADSGGVAMRKGARLGYVAQDVAFPPDVSVGQVLDRGLSEADKLKLVPQALGQAGFENGEALASSLSRGWQRRLALARELVPRPDILLVDEPTHHLAPRVIPWPAGL